MKYIKQSIEKKRYDFSELIDKRSILCLFITFALILISVFFFKNSYVRLWESIKSFGTSSVNNYNFGFNVDSGGTVPPVFIPDSFDSYKIRLKLYMLVFNIDNFRTFFSTSIVDLLMFLMIFLLVFFALKLSVNGFNYFLDKANNDYNVDSKPLYCAKRSNDVVLSPVKNFIKSHFAFVVETKIYWVLWLLIICMSLNFVSIGISFVSYYIYLLWSQNFPSIYRQVYKLFIDLSPAYNYVGLWVFLPFIFYFMRHNNKEIALSRLRYFDEKNWEFISNKGLMIMLVGSMGKGKTTLLVDMMLTYQRWARRRAEKKMRYYEAQFPNFPWQNFVRILKYAMLQKRIINLRSAGRFINVKKARFYNNMSSAKIFDYDYIKYGLEYDNKKEIVNIFDTLKNYAQVFFVYFIAETLLVSNISVRDDTLIFDNGNYPILDDDYLNRSSAFIRDTKTYSHILDFDLLRFGRKMLIDNCKTGALEFFSMGITEFAKERGNQNDLKELKRNSEEVNQKNDRMERAFNLMRHSSTIDNECFAFCVIDDQRKGALSANFVNLVQIVEIVSKTERKNAKPFFSILLKIYNKIYNWFLPIYKRYIVNRADNTLTMHILKNIVFALSRRVEESYNQYGYKQLTLRVVDGQNDERLTELFPYYIIFSKTYRNVFATDCYNKLLDRNGESGLADLATFQDLYPTRDEYLSEKSYFINEFEDCNDIENKGENSENKRGK